MYDDERAKKKLKEAMQLQFDCDPADCDCDACPVGKPMELVSGDSGVAVVATICGVISALKDIVEEPEVHRRKEGVAESIQILSYKAKFRKMPDIAGFVDEMRKMGAKISTKEGVLVIDVVGEVDK